MTQGRASIFRYILHADVPAYLACGWVARPSLVGTHHGDYSALCEWICDCAVAEPRRKRIARLAFLTVADSGAFVLNVGRGDQHIDRIEINAGQLANLIKDGTQALMDQRGWK